MNNKNKSAITKSNGDTMGTIKKVAISFLKVLLGAYFLGVLIELNVMLTNFMFNMTFKIFEMKYMSANLVEWANIVRSPMLSFLSIFPLILSSLSITALVVYMLSKVKYVFYKEEPVVVKSFLTIIVLISLLSTLFI